jgi:transposase
MKREGSLQPERLMSFRGVRVITALTLALEAAGPHRLSSIGNAFSYCGLTAACQSSTGKQQRGPISKKRQARQQTALIEAAELVLRWNHCEWHGNRLLIDWPRTSAFKLSPLPIPKKDPKTEK